MKNGFLSSSSSAALLSALVLVPASAKAQVQDLQTEASFGATTTGVQEAPSSSAQGGEGQTTGASSTVLSPADDRSAADADAIVVTARKRAENVQDVPQSIQVIRPQQLEAASVREFTDLPKVAPSLRGGDVGGTRIAGAAHSRASRNAGQHWSADGAGADRPRAAGNRSQHLRGS